LVARVSPQKTRRRGRRVREHVSGVVDDHDTSRHVRVAVQG
jgi:hypothetical protein